MTTRTVTDPHLSERPTMPWRPHDSLRPTMPVPKATEIGEPILAYASVMPSSKPANDVKRRGRGGLWLAVFGAVVFGVVVAVTVTPTLVQELGASEARELAGVPPSAARQSVVAPSERASVPAATAPEATPSTPTAAPRTEAPQASAPSVAQPSEDEPRAEPVTIEAIDATPAPREPRRAAFGLQRRGAGRQVAEARVQERRVGRRPEAPPPETSDAPLTAAAVRPVLERGQARFRQCYERALRHAGTAVDARVRVTLDIAPSGQVTNADVDGPDFGGMARCLRNAARRFQFPASAAGGQVPVPLSFTPLP
ncbi:MAG: AgmX/PglI C-terminal domain-containing protein [Sandaracinaceae bacterium]|nr:MAG: AgmX/PglI C-terminal domain-containing protein [Sandaracinaceae bacterium]